MQEQARSERVHRHDGLGGEELSEGQVVATTLREVHSTNRHSWGAVAWMDGQTYASPTCELDVHDASEAAMVLPPVCSTA